MLFSYNWLREYVKDLPPADEVARRLTMSGTEVESVTPAGCAVNGVVTAEVLTCGKHPNADKLQLCGVSTGKETHSIVCGAKNMKPGDKVALALPGAELPGGVKIKKSKIRGVESGGMMCSEKELGLKETSDGIMILPPETPLGLELEKILGPADAMLEVSITPNRADLLSIRGLARELSAIFSKPFADKGANTALQETGRAVTECAEVSVQDPRCKRYSARVVEGVKTGPSPAALSKRLEAHGIRPVNNVVDITNCVLLETGQPLHAFDLSKLDGKKIIVRPAKDGETIETIDGKKRELGAGTLVIADASAPVAVAGVMGGKGSEVDCATVDVLIESAWFEPASVRSASKKLGLSTDSSYRFERGVDINAVTRALDLATAMIKEFAGGGIAGSRVDIYLQPFKQEAIEFRLDRASAVLGIKLEPAEAAEIFERLGMTVAKKGGGLLVAPPSYRTDIRLEADLIEEAARIIGYDKIPATLPVVKLMEAQRPLIHALRSRLNETLTSAGFSEAVNYSFVSADAFALTGGRDNAGVAIRNPLTAEQSVMRNSLLPSLLSNLRYNIFQKSDNVRLFEVGPVFYAGEGKLPVEKWKVSGVMHGLRYGSNWNSPKEAIDFYDVKGAAESLLRAVGATNQAVSFSPDGTDESKRLFHPGKCAAVILNGAQAGIIGEAHPDINEKFELKAPAMLFELDLDALSKCFADSVRRYSPVPKFPESVRDIAFIVSEQMPYGEILSAIECLDTKLVEKVELFDVYWGSQVPKGKRSMAIRITYRSKEGTLRQEEVDELQSRVAGVLATGFGAKIRVG